MPEQSVIRAEQRLPVTIPSLVEELGALGVAPGMTLIVHSSLRALGWVCGGPVAVILALEELLGPSGTLVMPTHTSGLSDPGDWHNPPVPEAWWEPIRRTMPPYDPALTPTRLMGAIPECFRAQPGVRRSRHPQLSFAAWGARAAEIVENHSLAWSLGDQSPIARVYDLEGYVLLLGVGHANNTSLHLAEYRAEVPGKQHLFAKAPMLVDGQRRWVSFQDITLDDSDFVTIGADFARDTGQERRGKVGSATAILVPQRPLIDYAVQWMEKHRKAEG